MTAQKVLKQAFREGGYRDMRKLTWTVTLLCATGVAGYALMNLLVPEMRSQFVQNLFDDSGLATVIHLGGGAVAIVAGALQLNSGFRNASITRHRLLGRAYVIAIVLAGLAGFSLALEATGGIVAQSGFVGLAFAWLTTTLAAYILIVYGNVAAHRQWMVRSYAMTLAGFTLRLYLGLSVLMGISFAEAYPVLAWLCWLPNLILAEIFLSSRQQTAPP